MKRSWPFYEAGALSKRSLAYLSRMDGPIQFESFIYYPDRGELSLRDKMPVNRLAPQPNKLLVLLLEKYPEIVSRQEIKATIWPDVQVDFEKSLHYCVRQVRSALNDNAAQPTFIETIPRRGYRWIAEWEPVAEEQDVKKKSVSFSKKWLMVLPVVLVVLYLLGSAIFPPATANAPIRLAIMSFQPVTENSRFAGNDIALQLLEVLTNQYPERVEVIGPTTTDRYEPDQLKQLIRELDIDIILNGRFPKSDTSDRLLAEVIRAEDGAHIWVNYFEPGAEEKVIVNMLLEGLGQHYPVVGSR